MTSFTSFCQDSTWSKYIDQVGLTAGIWFPEKNKAIGPQSIIGLSAGFKKKVHSINFYADFIGLFSKIQDTLKIANNNTIISGKKNRRSAIYNFILLPIFIHGQNYIAT